MLPDCFLKLQASRYPYPMNINNPFISHIKTLVLLISLAGLLSACAKPYVFPASSSRVTPQLNAETAEMDDAFILPLRHWGNPEEDKAIVLGIHGLNDYSKGFESTGRHLAGKHITLFSYDQRGFGETAGHGLWHGSERLIKDSRAMAQLLRKKYPDKPLFLMGESMGGAIVLASLNDYGKNRNESIQGIILLAPAIWSRNTMPWYQRALLQLAAHTVPAKQLTGEGLDIIASDNIEMLRALGRDPLVIKATRVDVLYGVTNLMDIAAKVSLSDSSPNSLILYGKHDQIVPRDPTCHWLKTLPGVMQDSTVLYDNGYHMLNRDLQAHYVLDDIASWIDTVLEIDADTINIPLSLSAQEAAHRSVSNFCKD